MSTLTAPSLTSRTMQTILPAASIGTAIDGGLGYYDLVDRNAYTYVEVGPLARAVAGDTVTVLWAGTAVMLHPVTATKCSAKPPPTHRAVARNTYCLPTRLCQRAPWAKLHVYSAWGDAPVHMEERHLPR